MLLNVAEVKINGGRRAVNAAKVRELADSIREVGLLNPITVTSNYVLIAGAHRIEAVKALGWDMIDANIMYVDGLAVKLAEIDENLIRNELHYTERGDLLLERKAIYEGLHPETKRGVAQAIGMNKAKRNDVSEIISPTFATDTAQKIGVTKRTIESEIQVAKSLPPEVKAVVRERDIPKTDALKLARMEPEKQKAVVEKIVVGEAKSVTDAQKAIEKAERRETIIEQAKVEATVPSGEYSCIVIDPPWPYGTLFDPDGRRVANPYPEMSLADIAALEIKAKPDAVLFLWTTHRFIRDAFELLDCWDFEYRATLVWDKEKMGMGDLFRMQCEFCLVGIRGKPALDNSHSLRDIIREPRREHSRKPEAFYAIVETLCRGSKLEYFARERREGWEVFGNDTNRF